MQGFKWQKEHLVSSRLTELVYLMLLLTFVHSLALPHCVLCMGYVIVYMNNEICTVIAANPCFFMDVIVLGCSDQYKLRVCV